MAKELEKMGSFKYLEPNEIDAYIKNRIRALAKGPSAKSKWTDEEIQLRNQVIWDYVAQGLSSRRIKEHLQDRWGIGKTAARDYYVRAMKELTKESDDVRVHARGMMEERLLAVVENAMDNHQYKEACMALDQLNKIYGLYNTSQQIEIKDYKQIFKFQGFDGSDGE